MNRRQIASMLCLLLAFAPAAHAWTPFGGGYKQQVKAENIETDTTNFDNNLSGTDTDVQKALDTLDELVGGGGGSGDITSVVAGNGLTGGATSGAATLDIGPGYAMDVSADALDWDPTEVLGATTWSDGANASIAWTWNLSGTDPVLTFSSGAMALTGNISATNLSGTNTGDQTTITGNAGTATALAANGANASSGNAILGVDASGAAEGAFDVWTEAENTAAAYLNATAANLLYQSLDSDLTTIAGLTATTDNFLVSVASAWASRTPAQVRTTLGLVIGTNVQAWDADLDDLADGSLSASKVAGVADADYGDISVSSGVWSVDANSVALGTDTTGNYAAGDAEAGGATNLRDTAGSASLTTAGDINLDTSGLQIGIYDGTTEKAIPLIRHVTLTFDPAGWYDQESTYRAVPVMYVGDDAPHGVTLKAWKVNYVKGDPTTELDADLICDTTPDFNTAAGATVMDVLDTTAGASSATGSFDSATCANGSRMYIHFGADPTDANVVIAVDIWFYNEED